MESCADNFAISKTPSKAKTRPKVYEVSFLEGQIRNKIKSAEMTLQEFAQIIGVSKASLSRDLSTLGLGNASLGRIQRMALGLNMEVFPVLIPLDQPEIKEKILRLIGIKERSHLNYLGSQTETLESLKIRLKSNF